MLLFLFAAVSFTVTFIFRLALPQTNIWLTVPVFAGTYIGCFALLLLFVAFCTLFSDKNKIYTKDSLFFRKFYFLLTKTAFILLRIRVHISGREKLDAENLKLELSDKSSDHTRFLLVCNHLSTFDAIVTPYAFPGAKLAYISKPENFEIPLFGRFIRRMCYMPIDRENARNALTTIKQASELMKSDEVSVGVFPEGTRNKTDEILLDFKEGVFLAAKLANVPIVVTTLKNTNKIHKNAPLAATDVYLDIAGVIPAEEVHATSCANLSIKVRAMMEESISDNGKTEDDTEFVNA